MANWLGLHFSGSFIVSVLGSDVVLSLLFAEAVVDSDANTTQAADEDHSNDEAYHLLNGRVLDADERFVVVRAADLVLRGIVIDSRSKAADEIREVFGGHIGVGSVDEFAIADVDVAVLLAIVVVRRVDGSSVFGDADWLSELPLLPVCLVNLGCVVATRKELIAVFRHVQKASTGS